MWLSFDDSEKMLKIIKLKTYLVIINIKQTIAVEVYNWE